MLRDLLDRDDIVLSDSTTTDDIPGWDSLVHVNLIFGLEERFGIQVDGNKIFDFHRIGDLKTYIEERSRATRVAGQHWG